MRSLCAIALTGVTACSFSPRAAPPAEDAGIDAAEPPPVDAPPPPLDTTPEDEDGDGVADSADNCPGLTNPDQFDEDADATGDPCDACPQLADPAADQDGDRDGIGDGCDPRPDVGGDVLVYWNGFHVPGAGLPEPLAMVHGSGARWTVAGGALVFTRADDDWGLPAFDTGSATHSSDTTVEITASYTGGDASAAGAAVDVAGNDIDASECQARTDNDQRELWYWNGRFFGGWSRLANTGADTPEDTYRIVVHRTAAGLACTTTLGGDARELTSTRGSAGRTRAGLFARNVDARFHYLAIYTSP